LANPAHKGETTTKGNIMFAEKIQGYAEAKSNLESHAAIISAKSTEVVELNSKITDTTQQLTVIKEQLNAAPLQMAKNELSTEAFIQLRYNADALQAMFQGLTEVRTAQKAALSSLIQEQNILENHLKTMVKNYVEQMAGSFVSDAVVSINEPLKFFVSSVIAGEKYGTKPEEVYRQIGLQLAKLIYGEQNQNMAFIPALQNAKEHIESVKQSLLTEV
jgi:hypothetical protein